MSHKPARPPHLEEVFTEEDPTIIHPKHSKFSLQGPSKYGAGGRRAFGAKGRKTKQPKNDNKRWK